MAEGVDLDAGGEQVDQGGGVDAGRGEQGLADRGAELGEVALVADPGPVEDEELARATNLGVGMVVVLPPAEADRAAAFLAEREIPAWVMGEVAG